MKTTAGGHKNALVERGRKELEATGRRPKARPACLYPSLTLLGWDGALLTAEEGHCGHVALQSAVLVQVKVK